MGNRQSFVDFHRWECIATVDDQGSLIDYDPNDYITDTVLELCPFTYPNCGLYQYKEPSLNEMVKLTLEEQMAYSDAITRRYAKNPTFLKHMAGHTEDREYDDINYCTFGNIAFMVYHNPENEKWKLYYDRVVNYIKQKHQ